VEKLDIGHYDNHSGTVHTDSGDIPVWTDKISENKKKLNKAFAVSSCAVYTCPHSCLAQPV